MLKLEKEIENHNFKLEVPLNDAKINGRNLTNIGLFRKYIEEYLIANKLINTEMTVMCRQLSPTSQGVPLLKFMLLFLTKNGKVMKI